MSERLKQFLEDRERQAEYQDFARRFEEKPDDNSDEEAARRYRELMAQVDDGDEDEEMQQAYDAALGKLTPDERRILAEKFREANNDPSRPYAGYQGEQDLEEASSPRQIGRMTRKAAQEDPDLLEQVLGKDSPLSGKTGRIAMAGLAALAAKRFLGRR